MKELIPLFLVLFGLVLVYTVSMGVWVKSWFVHDKPVMPSLEPRYHKWKKTLNYFSRAWETDDRVSRKAFLRHMLELNLQSQIPKETIYDQYRCILQKAGYVKRVSPGVYEVTRPIPAHLTYRQARRQAYGYTAHT